MKYHNYIYYEYSEVADFVFGMDNDWKKSNELIPMYVVDLIKLRSVLNNRNKKSRLYRGDSEIMLAIGGERFNSVIDESSFEYFFPNAKMPSSYKNIEMPNYVILKNTFVIGLTAIATMPIILFNIASDLKVPFSSVLPLIPIGLGAKTLTDFFKSLKLCDFIGETDIEEYGDVFISNNSMILFEKFLEKEIKNNLEIIKEYILKMKSYENYEELLLSSDIKRKELYSLYDSIEGVQTEQNDLNQIKEMISKFILELTGSDIVIEDTFDSLEKESDEDRVKKIMSFTDSLLKR